MLLIFQTYWAIFYLFLSKNLCWHNFYFLKVGVNFLSILLIQTFFSEKFQKLLLKLFTSYYYLQHFIKYCIIQNSVRFNYKQLIKLFKLNNSMLLLLSSKMQANREQLYFYISVLRYDFSLLNYYLGSHLYMMNLNSKFKFLILKNFFRQKQKKVIPTETPIKTHLLILAPVMLTNTKVYRKNDKNLLMLKLILLPKVCCLTNKNQMM